MLLARMSGQAQHGSLADNTHPFINPAKDRKQKLAWKSLLFVLTVEQVDTYMLPILQAAQTGDLSLIRSRE